MFYNLSLLVSRRIGDAVENRPGIINALGVIAFKVIEDKSVFLVEISFNSFSLSFSLSLYSSFRASCFIVHFYTSINEPFYSSAVHVLLWHVFLFGLTVSAFLKWIFLCSLSQLLIQQCFNLFYAVSVLRDSFGFLIKKADLV